MEFQCVRYAFTQQGTIEQEQVSRTLTFVAPPRTLSIHPPAGIFQKQMLYLIQG
jgi:hypothetical protein